MSQVLLALIHNGELDRAPARTAGDQLVSLQLVNEAIEIWEQPALSAEVDFDELLQWRSEQRGLEQRWRRYLGRSKTWSGPLAACGEARFRIQTKWSRQTAAREWRARQIEKLVTAKHILAWRALMESDDDGILVLESDATWLEHSPVELGKFQMFDMDAPLYANAAGGLDLHALGIHHESQSEESGWMFMEPAVTNTSCAYLMSRPLAGIALNFLERNPDAALLGIDWLINSVFLEAAAQDVEIVCLHANPPALGHGSLTGVTESWHPGR